LIHNRQCAPNDYQRVFMQTSSDIIVIGAGIAGASVAAELARTHKVTILDMESAAGYHTTGRSAATFVPTYGPPVMRAMTRASEAFFRNPPAGFTEHPLITPRGEMMLAGPGDEAHVEQALGDGLREISFERAREIVPHLKPDGFTAILYDPSAEDLDVDALHQGFLKFFRAAGGQVVLDAKADTITRHGEAWQVTTSKGDFHTPILINAAGAWVDEVATTAGAARLGLQPKRRSAALVPIPDGWDVSAWPLVFGAGETYYFRPMSGKLMVSPADATPVEPHDAWAEDMAIAESIEHLQGAIDMEVTRLDHTWGGLRTFAPDGGPIVGFDPDLEGFFWLAGQGGYGIQTSPAVARTAAALVTGNPIPSDITAQGVSIETIDPRRFLSHNY
jgi:D-arginine dehydrogenase